MGVYVIGQVIRRTREGLGMTQEQLCEGICSVETLSRIENGKHMPNRANFQALMERMGRSGEKYLPSVRSEDMEMMVWWKQIEQLILKRKFEEFYQEIDAFEQRIDLDDVVNRQAVKRVRALADGYTGKIGSEEKRKRLVEALLCTVPYYEEGQVPRGVFSRTEIRILCNIAASYAEEEDFEKALPMMKQIAAYYETTQIDHRERATGEVLALANYAQCLGVHGDTEEAVRIGEQALRMCLEEQKGDILPGILYNIAFEKELLGEKENACKELLLQAFYAAELNCNQERMKSIRKHIEEHYPS